LRSCLRICKDKKFAADKEVFTTKSIITRKKLFLIMPTEFLQDHWLLLVQSTKHLSQLYPNIAPKEKILRIEGQSPDFTVTTNKNTYKSKNKVAIGAANTFQLMG
jgi:hypothetical protein